MRAQLLRRTTLLSWFLTFVVSVNGTWAEERLAKTDVSELHAARKVVTLDRVTAEKHPLWPALTMAVDSYQHIRRNVRDYSCQLVRRERVRGELLAPELMMAKVRHQRSHNGQVVVPFGLYLKVLAPTSVQGREVLYVDGQNDGMMLIRKGGNRFGFVTTRISPTSETAMVTNRYPLTEFGIENLVKRLIEVVKEDMTLSVNTHVDFYPDAKLDGRTCTAVKVVHQQYDQQLRFHSAIVYVDQELKVPVRYEAYDWPREAGGEPELLEEYTYRDVRLNVGFTEYDFDPSNEAYSVR